MWIESVQITSNTSVFGNLASYRTLPQPGEEKETLTRQLFRLLTEEKLIHFELWSSAISSYPPLYPPPLSYIPDGGTEEGVSPTYLTEEGVTTSRGQSPL